MSLEQKTKICEIGRQLYDRGYAAANDGNLSIRMSNGEILCTPTMTSKGSMKPEDVCTVDMDGKQIAGTKKRSSEIKLHLEIYRHRPDVNAVVHCHPPHATAFAVAREPIPQCVLPEVEIFLGEVPIAQYETPGSQAFSNSIVPFIKDSNVIVLANHGTVSFGVDLELAYWWTDILDAYCRILILAKQLGGINYIDCEKTKQLLAYKKEWGFSDLRVYGSQPGKNICGHQAFRDKWPAAGVCQRAFAAHPESDAGADQATSSQPIADASVPLSDAQLDELARRIAIRLGQHRA